MGPVIASIHEKRAEMRAQIMEMGQLEREPNIRRTRIDEIGASPG
jgi:CPA2 family monovalent cation:H+ antiporter-2